MPPHKRKREDLPKPEKKSRLSLEQKDQIFHLLDKNPAPSYACIAKQFNVTAAAICQLKANREKWESQIKEANNLTSTHARVSTLPPLDAALFAWFQSCRETKIQLSISLLQAKAMDIAAELLKQLPEGHETKALSDFKASNGFIEKFCDRHNIVCKRETGEADSADPAAVAKSIEEAQEAINAGNFALRDVFNADETGLFYKMSPNTTLAIRAENVKGTKKEKDRITVLCCANADGSERLPLLVIGKSACPRCFKGINVKALPCIYRSQRKAWMSVELFQEFLSGLDSKMKKQDRNILLILDNAPVHKIEVTLTNIKIHFLQPNTTSITQPMDAGIIRSFKCKYRAKLMKFKLSVVCSNLSNFVSDCISSF